MNYLSIRVMMLFFCSTCLPLIDFYLSFFLFLICTFSFRIHYLMTSHITALCHNQVLYDFISRTSNSIIVVKVVAIRGCHPSILYNLIFPSSTCFLQNYAFRLRLLKFSTYQQICYYFYNYLNCSVSYGDGWGRCIKIGYDFFFTQIFILYNLNPPLILSHLDR